MRIVRALVAAACVAGCAAGPMPHTLKNDDFELRNDVPRTIAQGALPFDKSYEELTPEERKIVLRDYPKLGPGGEPPYPANGLGPVVREVAKVESRALADGPAAMLVNVDATGEAQSVAVYRSADPGMTKALAFVLMHTAYKPAKCSGHPCEGQYLFSFNFRSR